MRSIAAICEVIDRYIEQMGLESPPEELPRLRDGYALEEVTSLDLRAVGISTVIWAAGYTFDYSLIKLPAFDDYGFPIQSRGVTHFPGLYFIGLPWLNGLKSETFVGAGEDAEWIARAIDTEMSGVRVEYEWNRPSMAQTIHTAQEEGT